jgi:DNA-binding NarL/FixJ family response regulator
VDTDSLPQIPFEGTDRLAGFRQSLAEAIRAGVRGRALDLAGKAVLALGADDFMSGRWLECENFAREALRSCDADRQPDLAVNLRLCTAPIAAARGEFRVAGPWARNLGSATADLRGSAWCHQLRARVLAAGGAGEFERAYRNATAISPPGTVPPHVAETVWVALDLVESAMRTRRIRAAEAHVRALQEAGVARFSPHFAMLVDACAGVAARDQRSERFFERAINVPGIERWPFDLARVQLAYGERLRRMRSAVASREHLIAALHLFTELGAGPWAMRASKELSATGLTKRRQTNYGSEALTSQEREVALLAASGLRNKDIAERLYLSPRTVGAHLRQVFPKLGIDSRSALRDKLGPSPETGVGENNVDASPRNRADAPQLTHQQMQIAALAASGMTNRQIGERLYLSHRTVGTHLYELFPKLGITARASLRDALGDLSTPQPIGATAQR